MNSCLAKRVEVYEPSNSPLSDLTSTINNHQSIPAGTALDLPLSNLDRPGILPARRRQNRLPL